MPGNNGHLCGWSVVAMRTDLSQTAWTQACFFLRICCTGMARAGTPHALRRMGEMCCKVCSPQGNQQILHRQQLENETLSRRSITEIYLMRSKRKVNRIILILNLCLPLCKDKVRSPSLPSSSTITHNRVAEWLLLTASPWCQNCTRTSHFSCLYHHNHTFSLQRESWISCWALYESTILI